MLNHISGSRAGIAAAPRLGGREARCPRRLGRPRARCGRGAEHDRQRRHVGTGRRLSSGALPAMVATRRKRTNN